jgi:hypothetical protein
MNQPLYFQWQNEILCKTIYPMRLPKLRDFLVFYKELDVWAEYKNKDISAEIGQYREAQRLAAVTAYKTYSSLRGYFMQPDARMYYMAFKPLDEAELTEINTLHNVFITSYPKDARGERDFIDGRIAAWQQHYKQKKADITSKQRRVNSIRDNNPSHPNLPKEMQELEQMQKVALPMAEKELDQLTAFSAAFDKIEKRKLEWYQKTKKDPAFAISEAEYLVQMPEQTPTVYDIAAWKVETYKASLESKTQYDLLEEIRQRFQKEPNRYPLWLQYMVVHFSGMRYASAHGSWADPKDLLVRLRTPGVEKQVKDMDDAAVEKLCKEKIAAYESPGNASPKLALTQDKDWKTKTSYNMANIKAPGPKTRRVGLSALLVDEMAYETKSMTTAQALNELKSMKATFPAWAWKEIVKFTPLRVTEVTDPDWEKLTPEEESQRYLPQYNDIRAVMDAWENADITAWREEHGRSHELIVTRAVCNETAEHIQHLRGHLPPGGLTPKPKWYLQNETENKFSGSPAPYFVKPKSANDYAPGASILWLRFVDKEPSAWQIAKPVETKTKEGLLPPAFKDRKAASKTAGIWEYKQGDIITRSRTVIRDDKTKGNQQQWLRWIHEATVVEIGETAEGAVMLTYETALPDDFKGTSSIGMFKKPIEWMLSDGPEDQYNRSFVGYVPEGQVPIEHIKEMLDWNKILRKSM